MLVLVTFKVGLESVEMRKNINTVAPTIQEIKSGTVAPGRSGLIRCEGAGVPPPAFEWYKGEKKLFNGQQGIIIQNFSTRSILTVTNVTQEHFGNYTCVAANKLGTTNASLPLNHVIAYGHGDGDDDDEGEKGDILVWNSSSKDNTA
ncbi:Neuronal growth regulator 1 [Galemys pyrenaicus]|uniref:Neuronal growth regulator 1 n=1 Tax=Galemys pyrenaicus TaxID=202257 RepID=A0A8J5ZVU6_GALPY|nr:Neuronal growth regulator 1 [Galemys pyrenaicus]